MDQVLDSTQLFDARARDARNAELADAQAKLIAAYETVFLLGGPSVETVLADLKRRGHFQSTIDPSDHGHLAFAEGQRDIVIYILSKIDEAKAGKHRKDPTHG